MKCISHMLHALLDSEVGDDFKKLNPCEFTHIKNGCNCEEWQSNVVVKWIETCYFTATPSSNLSKLRSKVWAYWMI